MTWCNKFGIHYLFNDVVVSLLSIITCIILYEHFCLHILHFTWLRCIRSCIEDLSHGFLVNRWLVHNQPTHGSRQPIRSCSAPSFNWKNDWFWLSGWIFHGECTSVCSYTLDRTYGESWLKAIKQSWPHQVASLCCLSTLREYWAYAKVSNDFDLWVSL